MKVHIFLDDNDRVLAITPASESPGLSKLPAGEEAIIFGRSEPVQNMPRLRRYELDSEVDLSINLDQFETNQMQQKAVDVIKTRPELRSVEL